MNKYKGNEKERAPFSQYFVSIRLYFDGIASKETKLQSNVNKHTLHIRWH